VIVGTGYIVGGPYPEIDVGKGEGEDEVSDSRITGLKLEDSVAESGFERDVEDEVLDAEVTRLGLEDSVAESSLELVVACDVLFASAAFVGVLRLVDAAFIKQEQALDSRDAGMTKIELVKVCLVLEIS